MFAKVDHNSGASLLHCVGGLLEIGMQDLNYLEASLDPGGGRLIEGVDEVVFEDFSHYGEHQNLVLFGATRSALNFQRFHD